MLCLSSLEIHYAKFVTVCSHSYGTNDHLRDTVRHLLEAMTQNATQFMVENILQLALRTVQDSEVEAHSLGKTWATLIADALKKIRKGVVIVEVYKELTEQLHGLPSGDSLKMFCNRS